MPAAAKKPVSSNSGGGEPPDAGVRGGFAERHGPTVLMVAGMVLMLAAGAAALLDRPWPSLGSIAAVGLLALALGALLGRMEGRFKILGLSGTLRPNGGHHESRG